MSILHSTPAGRRGTPGPAPEVPSFLERRLETVKADDRMRSMHVTGSVQSMVDLWCIYIYTYYHIYIYIYMVDRKNINKVWIYYMVDL